MLVFPVVWVWIVLYMFQLFSVSVWNTGYVSFGMTVPVFVRSLLMLYDGREKFGDRAMFGIWVRELLSVGFCNGLETGRQDCYQC